MNRRKYIKVEYLQAVPYSDCRREHVWLFGLTNRQLTVTKIAGTLWRTCTLISAKDLHILLTCRRRLWIISSMEKRRRPCCGACLQEMKKILTATTIHYHHSKNYCSCSPRNRSSRNMRRKLNIFKLSEQLQSTMRFLQGAGRVQDSRARRM